MAHIHAGDATTNGPVVVVLVPVGGMEGVSDSRRLLTVAPQHCGQRLRLRREGASATADRPALARPHVLLPSHIAP